MTLQDEAELLKLEYKLLREVEILEAYIIEAQKLKNKSKQELNNVQQKLKSKKYGGNSNRIEVPYRNTKR